MRTALLRQALRSLLLLALCLSLASVLIDGWILRREPTRRGPVTATCFQPRGSAAQHGFNALTTSVRFASQQLPSDEEGGRVGGAAGLDSAKQHQQGDGDDEAPGAEEVLEKKKSIDKKPPRRKVKYDLGIGKQYDNLGDITQNWRPPEPVKKPSFVSVEAAAQRLGLSEQQPQQDKKKPSQKKDGGAPSSSSSSKTNKKLAKPLRTRRMIPKDSKSEKLRAALWDEHHYFSSEQEADKQQQRDDDTNLRFVGGATSTAPAAINGDNSTTSTPSTSTKRKSFDETKVAFDSMSGMSIHRPKAFYPDIDLSIPDSVYKDDGSVDLVWDLLRWEAYKQATREPLLVSFLHSTILHHSSLESSLAFLLANRLQSPAMMISTQLQSVIMDALAGDAVFRRSLRADMMSVRDRDPACLMLPDVFLYFKGFHALQTYRVAHRLWDQGKQVLAKYLQSQVSQIFQIDIHPNATLGSGIMLDHGTGIVIGETATVGHNCSILHHVTLGGSGKKGVLRHPQLGDGVLLGAGATVLGPVTIGDGTQVGAGTLVISDLPAHCVAVGVPARIIGSFVDVTQQPSIGMDQMMDNSEKIITFETEGI